MTWLQASGSFQHMPCDHSTLDCPSRHLPFKYLWQSHVCTTALKGVHYCQQWLAHTWVYAREAPRVAHRSTSAAPAAFESQAGAEAPGAEGT